MDIIHDPESGTPGALLRPQSPAPRSGFVQQGDGANGHRRFGEDAFEFMNIFGHSQSARSVAVAHPCRSAEKTL